MKNSIETLNTLLGKGIVKFVYIKQDGSVRTAIGTRNIAIIEHLKKESVNAKKAHFYFENCNGYFDIVRDDWRQFNENRFVRIEEEHMDIPNAIMGSLLEMAENFGMPKTTDHQKEWCKKYNGGRGLNGVLLTAAENGGSGCLGWPGAPTMEQADSATHKTHRDALISRLRELRKEENEILAELFG